MEARRRRFHISQDDTLSLRDRQSIISENDSTIDHLHNLSIQGDTSQSPPTEEQRDQIDTGSTGGRQHLNSSSSDGGSSNMARATAGAR